MKLHRIFLVMVLLSASATMFAQADSLQTTGNKLTVYKNFIRQGDAAYGLENFEEATGYYKKALEVMPGDRYASYKLEDANTMYEIKRDDEAYQQAIQAADLFFEQANYPSAKLKYEEALKIRPDEKYPKRKIKEIEQLLADTEKNKARQDKIDKAYNDVIRQADVTFDKALYPASKSFYNQALTIKPEEAYPRRRIAEIDALLEAKARKAANARILNEQYAKLIQEGDLGFASKKYPVARKAYEEAAALKPAETYPPDQLRKIDELERAVAEEPKVAAESKPVAFVENIEMQSVTEKTAPKQTEKASPSEKPEKNDVAKVVPTEKVEPKAIVETKSSEPAEPKAIVEAKSAAQTKNEPIVETVPSAKELPKSYENPVKQVVPESIEKNAVVEPSYSGNTAVLAEPTEEKPGGSRYPAKLNSAPPEKETVLKYSLEDQSLIIENEKKYLMFIAAGDEAFSQSNYKESRAQYVNASAVKPKELYPRHKIAEIDQLLSLDTSNLMNALAENDPYYIAIKRADEAMVEKELNVAAFYYRKAQGIRGFEKYPVAQLALIEQMKENIRLAKLEQNYEDNLQKGDDFFAQQEYPSSRYYFKKALGIKPEALYPQSRLQDIDEALRMRKKDNRQGDFEMYKKRGFEALNENELSVAEYYYEKALYLKATDKEVNEKLDEIYRRKNTVADMDKADQYSRAIRTADDHFNHKSYQSARYFYLKALEYKSNDTYAKEQLAKISN